MVQIISNNRQNLDHDEGNCRDDSDFHHHVDENNKQILSNCIILENV